MLRYAIRGGDPQRPHVLAEYVTYDDHLESVEAMTTALEAVQHAHKMDDPAMWAVAMTLVDAAKGASVEPTVPANEWVPENGGVDGSGKSVAKGASDECD